MRYRLLFSVSICLFGLIACVPLEQTRPKSESAEYHYLLGVSALNEQNPTDALKEFLQAAERDAKDPKIQAGLAQAYWLKQAHDLAVTHFKRAIELSDNDPKYHNNLAALYLSMERYDEAIASFRKAADNLLFDRPELAWTGIGLANVKKQDYPAAQSAYRKAMKINPRYYMAPFQLGELYYNLERPVEALEMFTLTLELAPGFADGYYWQGLVLMKIKDTVRAKKAFLEVVRLAPQSDSARLAANYLKIINK